MSKKIYKVGKFWLVMGISVTGLIVMTPSAAATTNRSKTVGVGQLAVMSQTASVSGQVNNTTVATNQNDDTKVGADNNIKANDAVVYKDQLWGFGDSTTVGYNIDEDGESFDQYAADDLKLNYNGRLGISGTSIQNDMGYMAERLVNDPNYYRSVPDVVVGLGVNDVFVGNKNLNFVAETFKNNLLKISQANPKARMYIMLPQGYYYGGNNNDTVSAGGYSLNQLRDIETQIGRDMGIPVIDSGVVTDQNHTVTLPDGLHPSKSAYAAIGHELARQMRANRTMTIHASPVSYNIPDNGYQKTLAGSYLWLQDAIPYTGFQYYMGTYYWFNHGVRQNNSWHKAWGNQYYTDDGGRAVQGLQQIDGKWYDFGSDGTYYLRTNQDVNMAGQHYRSNSQGVIKPWQGYIYDGSAQNGGYRWYEDGHLFTGFRYYMGTYYWFNQGVRQNTGWRSAWGLTYYTGEDGRALQGNQNISGQWYNFGENGTYYLRTNQIATVNGFLYHSDTHGILKPWQGYIYDDSPSNGGYRWYEDGQVFTGFRYYMGTYYWFDQGVRQNTGWRRAWGLTYYTGEDGRALQGHQNIDGQWYNFGNDGTFYLR